MYRSKLYRELKWKYLEKKLRLVVAIGLLCWLAYMYQMLTALTFLSYQRVVIFN